MIWAKFDDQIIHFHQKRSDARDISSELSRVLSKFSQESVEQVFIGQLDGFWWDVFKLTTIFRHDEFQIGLELILVSC